MFFSGISDESGQPIATQVRAHQDLGWKHLELRIVDGVNITQLNDSAFDDVRRAVLEANMTVSCFGSAIANWARPITTEFQVDLDDLNRAIPRMRALSTPYIRVMSYPNHTEEPLPESTWRKESIRRMREMATIAEGEGIVLVHENCSGWGGLSAENSNILLGEVGSPALKVVFDTGNPVTYGQDTWEYYKAVRKDIVYVHIKDAVREKGVDHYVVCGEGEGYVPEVVGDLLATGYDGGFSIEPHLAAIIHTGQQASSDEQLYDSYVNYGRKLMDIVQRAQARA